MRTLMLLILWTLPALLLSAPADAQTSTWRPLQPHDNGLHFDPGHAGTGLTLTVQDTGAGVRVIGQVMTFDQLGTPVWLVFDAARPEPALQFVHHYALGRIGMARYTLPLWRPVLNAPAELAGEVDITSHRDRGLTVRYAADLDGMELVGSWRTVQLLRPNNPDPAPVICEQGGFSPPRPQPAACWR